MDVYAEITGIKYNPCLCRELKIYDFSNLEHALLNDTSFLLNIDSKTTIAFSWWVSPKRTRSYPYARVYDTLGFQGKKVTIIPIVKDEGIEGERDFLQWDTISLMSLLGVYVIISYYNSAEKSARYEHKITKQKFDCKYIAQELQNILSYQSDALHWNVLQLDKVGMLAQMSLDAYERISKELEVKMHSKTQFQKRIDELVKGKEAFMALSRHFAKDAQLRESQTIQPKEQITGLKTTLTIKNYLGGYYFFTCDEAVIFKESIHLIESKHSKQSYLPSLDDIKDGLIKMILFSNFSEVKIDGVKYSPVTILKLTTDLDFSYDKLRSSQRKYLQKLKEEALLNGFKVFINQSDLQNMVKNYRGTQKTAF